jgi:hypothetical protein
LAHKRPICIVRDCNRFEAVAGAVSNTRRGHRQSEPICHRMVCPDPLPIDCRLGAGRALVWSRHEPRASSGHPKFQAVGLMAG